MVTAPSNPDADTTRGPITACAQGLLVTGRAAQQAVAADERLRGSLERGPRRDAPDWRPRLLAAVVRSRVRSAFTAERQIVGQTARLQMGESPMAALSPFYGAGTRRDWTPGSQASGC